MSRIGVRRGGETTSYMALAGETVLDVLRRNGVFLPAPCGGTGKCGKCRVTVEEKGRRYSVRSCRRLADRDMTVILDELPADAVWESGAPADGGDYGLAVDVGTTTVAVSLVHLGDRTRVGMGTAWSAQSPYGADVVSRMQYAMEKPEGLSRLGSLIREQILAMGDELCLRAGISSGLVKKIFLAGNTVMEHFVAGEKVEPIALAPYIPVKLFDEGVPGAFPERDGLPAMMSPCVAGYIGGDVTAGILAAGIFEKHEKSLYLDIGTNGEMALGGADGFLCCSVACGPAFEGAEISCGMTGRTGAICRAVWEDGELITQTIGGAAPIGICGSGLLDLLAALVKAGVVDETGRLLPPEELDEIYPWLSEDENENGLVRLGENVYFTAGDVRKLQLAKGAVAAGIEVLLRQSGTAPEEVDTLYLTGGFGSHLNPESAAAIGMIPPALKDRVVVLGNAAHVGAELALTDDSAWEKLLKIQKACTYRELATDTVFAELFIENMMFENGED